ncbi:MAG: AraC family transcriptional regulator [Clostridia bacterium]|nr:AraC family transcriptional regulator [Clostridia bacterium]
MIDDFKMSICSQYTFNLSLHCYYCGSKKVEEEKWNPQYTDNYTLFYVFNGKGNVKIGENTFQINSPQGFLVEPKTQANFHSIGEPCKIAWIGFYGFLAKNYLGRTGISVEKPIFEDDKEGAIGKLILSILEDSKRDHNRYCRITASLYMIFSKLLDIHDTKKLSLSTNPMEYYVHKAIQYIDTNYSEKLTVTQIADYVGINRKYLYSIFKNKMSIGPQQYLVTYRMSKACQFLEETDLTIAQIARIVSYDNPFNFTKMFKKTIGISPKEYRCNPIFVDHKVLNLF